MIKVLSVNGKIPLVDGKAIKALDDIVMRVDGGYIQYSTDNGKTWVNLIAEADLKGDTGPQGTPGTPGAPGKDGHSPVVTATKSGKTTTISVDGIAIATVEDGADGAPGVAGAPGKDGAGMDITGATVGQIAKITAVDDTGKPTAWEPVDMPTGGGGNKGWTLLYDGTITIEEAVRRITVGLLVPCDGMVDFIGYITWTSNTNTENANDNINITVGKANMAYGRIGDASNAGNSVFQATVTSNYTYWGRATTPVDLKFNITNMQYCLYYNNDTPDYENAIIDFFSKTYAGTITLQLYGR